MKHASTGSREQIRKHFLKIPREQQTECVSELCDQVGRGGRGVARCVAVSLTTVPLHAHMQSANLTQNSVAEHLMMTLLDGKQLITVLKQVLNHKIDLTIKDVTTIANDLLNGDRLACKALVGSSGFLAHSLTLLYSRR